MSTPLARLSWTIPGRFTSSLGLPEDKIEAVALGGIIRAVAPFVGDGHHLGAEEAAWLSKEDQAST